VPRQRQSAPLVVYTEYAECFEEFRLDFGDEMTDPGDKIMAQGLEILEQTAGL